MYTIRVDKISESPAGSGRFNGFRVPTGRGRTPPAPQDRQIQFIGDSDTVGYGNLSPSRDCTAEEVIELTDTQDAYSPRVGQHFQADYETIARSGIGVVRNYAGMQAGRTMPLLYPRALPGEITPVAANG